MGPNLDLVAVPIRYLAVRTPWAWLIGRSRFPTGAILALGGKIARWIVEGAPRPLSCAQ